MPTVCLLSEYASAAKKEVADQLPRFGLITGNTGGKWLEENPRKALRTIARLGYKSVPLKEGLNSPLSERPTINLYFGSYTFL